MVAAVDPYLIDWLDLSFRFLHVIAAIVWIGTSSTSSLDNHLRPARARRFDGRVVGEIHGGGFYRIGSRPPPTIGATALVQVGGVHDVAVRVRAVRVAVLPAAARVPIDTSVADSRRPSPSARASRCSPWDGSSTTAVPDGRQAERGARRDRRRLCQITAYGSRTCSRRAAYHRVGAMLGTILANVFFVIIPAHWELIRAKQAGRSRTAAGARGKGARCTTTT